MLQTNTNAQNKNERQSASKKKTHFDENNILETFHPKKKDYGFMNINEANTPYPRSQEPVDATVLRDKLMSMNREYDPDLSSPSSSILNLSQVGSQQYNTPPPSQQEEFLMKRKKFYASEFLIAKQRLLSNEVHQPGEIVIAANLPRLSIMQSQHQLEQNLMRFGRPLEMDKSQER